MKKEKQKKRNGKGGMEKEEWKMRNENRNTMKDKAKRR